VSDAGTDTSRTLHVRVEGRVQGVGFRRFVERTAVSLGVAGWARNLTDGAVEVLALGPETAIARLRERLEIGPPQAAVARLRDLTGGAAVPDRRSFQLMPDAAPGAPVQLPRGRP
jgi:acylphosphatase